MDQSVYDRLAKVLRDVRERFPEDAFTKHQRLRGLLSDHLPDADREIRIALDAIDEGVIGILTDSPDAELGMQIDRLVTRLETSRGIREDIARQVIQAFAFSLELGDLPSTITTQAVNDSVPPPAESDEWVGVSEAVQSAAAESPQPTDTHSASEPAKKTDASALMDKVMEGNNRYYLAAAVVVIGLFMFNQQGQDSGPPQGQTPQPQQGTPPQGQTPPQQRGVPQGGGVPQGQSPVVQQPQGQNPQGQNPQQQPGVQLPQGQNPGVPQNPQQGANQQVWYDDYGNVWTVSFGGNQFQGYNSTPAVARGMLGQFDQQTGAIYYQIFDQNNQPIAEGQGQMTDQQHFNFYTVDLYGNVVGQGLMHINHNHN